MAKTKKRATSAEMQEKKAWALDYIHNTPDLTRAELNMLAENKFGAGFGNNTLTTIFAEARGGKTAPKGKKTQPTVERKSTETAWQILGKITMKPEAQGLTNLIGQLRRFGVLKITMRSGLVLDLDDLDNQ